MKIAVYTAICGNKDTLKENQCFEGADFFIYSDDPEIISTKWSLQPTGNLFRDPVREAKLFKILPHIFLREYDYTLWIDGSVTLKVPAESLIQKYLQNTDLALFKHWGGYDCLYQEAEICKNLHLDEPSLINRQVRRYRDEGYPEKNGLAECTVLLRRNTEVINDFNEKWWAEICAGSKRDQISFNYVVWKTGLKYTYFPGQVQNDPRDIRKNGNPYFSWQKHRNVDNG